MNGSDVPTPAFRPDAGRWLGGVCAGVAARWGQPVARVRAAFLGATVLLGLGPIVYLAAWLLLPAEGADGRADGARGIVVLAQVCGAVLGLAGMAVAASVAVVLGVGWVVVGLAAAVFVGGLAVWPRSSPAWILLPVGALALPSVALAAGGVAIDPRTAPQVVVPRTSEELSQRALRSGLGTLEVDLRHSTLPASGQMTLRVEAGVRRTLVALPHDRCVRVEVRQHELPLLLRAVRAGLGAQPAGLATATPGVELFGEVRADEHLATAASARRPPTLAIDFSSDGGELVVRDYPDGIDPATEPGWPGYLVSPEPRPDTTGISRAAARRLVRSWRTRRAAQKRSQRAVERAMPGPCARKEARR